MSREYLFTFISNDSGKEGSEQAVVGTKVSSMIVQRLIEHLLATKKQESGSCCLLLRKAVLLYLELGCGQGKNCVLASCALGFKLAQLCCFKDTTD